jgi:hypothetical protein
VDDLMASYDYRTPADDRHEAAARLSVARS